MSSASPLPRYRYPALSSRSTVLGLTAPTALHLADQPVQHRNAQRAAGLERVHADVEIPADIVLLAERRPPDVADSLRIGDALRRCIGAEPIEIEVHRVVDDVVHRQVHEAIAAALVVLVVRPLVG